jgi:hypothetical protein
MSQTRLFSLGRHAQVRRDPPGARVFYDFRLI